MRPLTESAIKILTDYVNTVHGGVRSRAAKALNIPFMTLSQWLDGKRSPTLEALAPVFETLNVSFLQQGEPTPKDVLFVNAKATPAGELAESPNAEDYLAAPLVGEAGAGPGYIPQNAIKSWFLVYRHQAAVRYRRNLIAVELGPNSTSMRPTLSPGDIVLIDRDDRDVSVAGRMMLVLDPKDGSGMIKRVAVDEEGADLRIVFFSDNQVGNPPKTYSLRHDFGNDLERAIVGRVVWAWADMKDR